MLIAACAVSLLAAPVASGAAAAGSTGKGTVSGVVTGHGRPLKGICVFVTQVQLARFYRVNTASNGHYTVGSVVPGRYYVTFGGCAGEGNWLLQWYKGVTSPDDTPIKPPPGVTALQVRAGRTLTGIDARMKLGASVSGTVTSATTGAGVARICVSSTSSVKDTFVIVYTTPGGHYTLHALFPATYQIEFSCGWDNNHNYAPQWWQNSATVAGATPVHITGAQNVQNINAKLGPGAVITGTVLAGSASGPPIPEVCVTASTSIPNASTSTSTATDGTYRLAGLASGKYNVVFDPDCGGTSQYQGQTIPVTTKEGTTLSGVNAYLQPTK